MKKLINILEEIKNKPDCTTLNALSFMIEDNELERIKNIIIPQLKYIEDEIDFLIFVKIRESKNEDDAQQYFYVLQKIQEILAMLFFKDQIIISNKLKKFIYGCDRLDDIWLRRAIYNNVKNGTYDYDVV